MDELGASKNTESHSSQAESMMAIMLTVNVDNAETDQILFDRFIGAKEKLRIKDETYLENIIDYKLEGIKNSIMVISSFELAI